MHSAPQPKPQQQQQQAVAAFLPSLPTSPSLLTAISEKLLGAGSLAAIITHESLRCRLGAPQNEERPHPGSPTAPFEEEETVEAPSQQKREPGWAPLEDKELLKTVAALQAACPSVCVLASLLPLVSLFDQLAPRRRLLAPFPPHPSVEEVPAAPDRGPSRLVLIPLYQPHDDEEGEESFECELSPLLSRVGPAWSLASCPILETAAAAAAEARQAAAAAGAAAAASCMLGSWRKVALEVGALRALEPNARIFVVFIGTRMALTTPQPAPPEAEEDYQAGEATEGASCSAAAASGSSGATIKPSAALSYAAAAAAGSSSSRNSNRGRMKRKQRTRVGDLLPSLDILVCEMLLLWKADTAYEHNEEAAAALLLRLARTAATTRHLRLLPRGKLRRLAATAREEAAAQAAAAAAAEHTKPVNNEASAAPPSEPLGAHTSPRALQRLWKAQLLQIPGVSEEVAGAVSVAFPTPSVLFARAAAEAAAVEAAATEAAAAEGTPGVQSTSSTKKRRRGLTLPAAPQLQAELSAVVVPGRFGNRRVGEALARRILRVFVLEKDSEATV